jgi:hypothetical protein
MSFLQKELSNPLLIRGGSIDLATTPSHSIELLRRLTASLVISPTSLYNTLLIALAGITCLWKANEARKDYQINKTNEFMETKSPEVKSLQVRFLIVFWLMRMADWLQGPYFYEVYSSKIINGLPISIDLVSKLFLVGFATTGEYSSVDMRSSNI